MSDFTAMHIFFGVTTAFVVLLMLGAGLLIYRLYRILGHLETLASHVSDEGAKIREDIAALRAKAGEQGARAAKLAAFLGKFAAWFAIAETMWTIQKKVRRKQPKSD